MKYVTVGSEKDQDLKVTVNFALAVQLLPSGEKKICTILVQVTI